MGVFQQKASTQQDFDLAPAGAHSACLIALIDLGTHADTYQGGAPKDVRKIFWLWEIDHTPEGSKGRAVIGNEYNLSFNSKAKMRLMIETWRGKKFNDDEEYDILKLLGKPCLLTITHETKNDRTNAKISAIGPMPKGMTPLKPSRPLIQFDLDSGEPFPTADYLPWTFGKKLIDKFNQCHEKAGKSPVGAATSANGSKQPVGAGVGAGDDSSSWLVD